MLKTIYKTTVEDQSCYHPVSLMAELPAFPCCWPLSAAAPHLAHQSTVHSAGLSPDRLAKSTLAIVGVLSCGVTIYNGRGGMTGKPMHIPYCVVTRLESGRVRNVVNEIDENAFIVIHPLTDAYWADFAGAAIDIRSVNLFRLN